MSKFPRGSEWRKWDLHFHTPSSYDYKKTCSDEELIEKLVGNNIAAVAVTDHHFIDVERILALQKLTIDRMTIFPGIELRSELGGSESIHFIGIFAESCDIATIWTKLQGQLHLTDADIKKKGHDKIYVDLKEACTLIHELGGMVSIHAGSKSNTIECITNTLSYKQAIKHDILEHIDIFEMGKPADCDDYKKHVYPNIASKPPMIVCSDNHEIPLYGERPFCWVKADPTFEGLRRILAEPHGRVVVGTFPHKLADVSNNRSRYLESIAIEAIGNTKPPHWFENTLVLNSGLVAIIGKKGSGKSALTDILGLAGSSHIDPGHYSFLRKDKFRKRGLAKNYEARLSWADGISATVNLNDEVDTNTRVEQVRYLPQEYVESICNETGVSEMFQREINQVVFSYIPETGRLGTKDLKTLLELQTSVINERLLALRNDLKGLVAKKVELEAKKRESYSQSLRNKLKLKQQELAAISDPVKVEKPDAAPDQETQDRLAAIKEEIIKCELDIVGAQQSLSTTNAKNVALNTIQERLKTLEQQHTAAEASSRDEFTLLGLDFNKLVHLTLNRAPLDELAKELNSERNRLMELLGQAKLVTPGLTCLTAKKEELAKSLETMQAQLDAKNQAYLQFLIAQDNVEARRKSINGSADVPGVDTIYAVETELEYISNKLADDIRSQEEYVLKKVDEIFDVIVSKSKAYEAIYRPLRDFVDSEKATQERAECVLTFDVGIVCDKKWFANEFLSNIDQGRNGSFQGKQKGWIRITDILHRNSFESKEGVRSFLVELLDNLSFDRSAVGDIQVDVESQFVSGVGTYLHLLELLYCLEYLDVKYKLQFNGKDLNQDEFSPGERGAILLIFYLLIDQDNIPLIIDQPEENLDNESVYSLLVPYIKRAKENRQIIVVTHNPNLAVVCDAEQIIHCGMNKTNSEIRYESGSIEHPKLNKHITDILEGTMPAFKKREDAYLEDL